MTITYSRRSQMIPGYFKLMCQHAGTIVPVPQPPSRLKAADRAFVTDQLVREWRQHTSCNCALDDSPTSSA